MFGHSRKRSHSTQSSRKYPLGSLSPGFFSWKRERRRGENADPAAPPSPGGAPGLLRSPLPRPPPNPSQPPPPSAGRAAFSSLTLALPASSFFCLSSSSIASAGKAGRRQARDRDRKERSVHTGMRPQAPRPREQVWARRSPPPEWN